MNVSVTKTRFVIGMSFCCGVAIAGFLKDGDWFALAVAIATGLAAVLAICRPEAESRPTKGAGS